MPQAEDGFSIRQKTAQPYKPIAEASKRGNTTKQVNMASALDDSDPRSIVSFLREEIDLATGMAIHDHVVRNDLDQDEYTVNLLLNMYGKCGALEEARDMFLPLPNTNVVAWNAMISVYVQSGCSNDALQLFKYMQSNCVEPTKVTFMSILNACDHPVKFAEGRRIHEYIVGTGFEADPALGTAVVSMYGKCGSASDAACMFNRLFHRSIISWTAMISVYSSNGLGENAYKVFQGMQEDGMAPNQITFLGILRAIDCHSMLHMGEDVHTCMTKVGCESDVVLGTALSNMYGKCGALVEARSVFDHLTTRSTVSWNAMIQAYAQKQQGHDALELFQKMQKDGVKADNCTFVSVLTACSSLEELRSGEEIHGCIKRSKFESDVVVATSLITMYIKCGALDSARTVFDRMHFRNAVSWNAIIAGYVQNGRGREALQLFCCMLEEGIMPDKVTYIGIASACESLEESKVLHSRLYGNEAESDVHLGTAVLNMYGKCGGVRDALAMFNRMNRRNTVSWNAMICVYLQQGQAKEALGLFRQLQDEGLKLDQGTYINVLTACASSSDVTEGRRIHMCILYNGMDGTTDVGTALVNMYGKCKSFEEAFSTLSTMSQRNHVTWNAILGACVQYDYNHEALCVFQEMIDEGIKPDRITFVSMLTACANLSSLGEGKTSHALTVCNGLELNVDVGTALINMYGKCGSFVAALAVFNKLSDRDIICWNSVMAVYAQHGLGRKALLLYVRMLDEGQLPDGVTFLSLLSACSHAGLLDEGLQCFILMSEEHDIQPQVEHYGCMVDLFGRSGKLLEAEKSIYKMATDCHSLLWRTLLGACKLHNDLKRARHAAKHAMDLDAEKGAPYVLLSSMYAVGEEE